MAESKNPELHVIEEPRNDMMDTAIGFGVFFGVLFLIALIAGVASIMGAHPPAAH